MEKLKLSSVYGEMRGDLISRSALLAKAEWEESYMGTDGFRYVRLSDVLDAPAVEAEPVVHAHWIRVGWGYYKCSHCDTEANLLLRSEPKNYCANCGARMDELLELRTCYCPLCDKHFGILSDDSMGNCPECGHHVVLHGKED